MTELDVSGLATVAQAIAIIDSTPVQPRVVRMNIREALGARLARDVVSDRDYPPFDKSLMDGFAVRSADVEQTPRDLIVQGEVAAGQWFGRMVEPGHAVAIMTGAPMPPGADGVVPVEETERQGNRVRILKLIVPGKFIARRGSDIGNAQVVLKKGQIVGPAQMAVAASVGAGVVEVYARPRVAILTTGDELVRVGETPGPAQIRDCNGIMLYGLLRQMGCDIVDLGMVEDDPTSIREMLADGMRYDCLFVSGGMSMGEYDYVPKALIELGVELKLTKLKIKPGKPFVFGVGKRRFLPGAMDERAYADMTHSLPREPDLGKCYVFGLPGNPVSGFVCTVRFASRIIQRISGATSVEENWQEGELAEDLPANGPREFYQPAIVEDGKVTPLNWKGSGDIFTLARANALLFRPEKDSAHKAGETATFIGI